MTSSAPVELHFERWGESGPAVVILHGLFGSSSNWRSVAKRLAATRRIFVVDQRNHGRSPHAADHSYGDLAGDVLAFLDTHELTSCFLVGHSMGGKVAMLLATQHPERVAGLVVVDIAPSGDGGSELRRILETMRQIDPSSSSSREDLDSQLARGIPDTRVRAFLLMNLTRGEHGRFRWRLGLTELSGAFDEIVAPLALDRPYDGPSLFVRGGRSGYIEDRDLAEISRLFPRGAVATIANAGHWVHAETPEEFLVAVDGFLSRCTRSG